MSDDWVPHTHEQRPTHCDQCGLRWPCDYEDMRTEIERLRARLAEYEGQTQSALTPEDIGMVPARNVLVDVAGVKIKCRAVEDLWRFPDEQQ